MARDFDKRSLSAAKRSSSTTTFRKPSMNSGLSHQKTPREYSPLVASGEGSTYGENRNLRFSIASEMRTMSFTARAADATRFPARLSPRSHLVRSWAASKGNVRKRYALIMELGRMFLVCSKYDRIHKPSAENSVSKAAASEARVFNDEEDTSITLAS